ncbi:UPF0598 protein C8orf82-like [Tropilaelaps mercedesae]|uniref:UPF0598 protein C8orf82-like n=1 Tax=Tropilaelaps mercedesae TaxID=418985 RepID=A0A1V9XCI6_9ACAR|nr:UPF0598 protein C8orf82-like [Tropilaelaps mercedesae]
MTARALAAPSRAVQWTNSFHMSMIAQRSKCDVRRNSQQRDSRRRVTYVQGQAGTKFKREYFYMVDHQGMLFLDDARMKNFTSCFKEHKFLHFFFTRVRLNNTGFYQDVFPYVSPCGVEMNYIRCDDVPIVFTQLLPEENVLLHNHAGTKLQVRNFHIRLTPT